MKHAFLFPYLSLIVLTFAGSIISGATGTEQQERPNILWITSEDHGPQMGCYGDDYATTPNVDQLASVGLRYNHAWSTYPVCAAARTTIISGLYPMSTGAEHMRSHVLHPKGLKMYPQFLQEIGYYCTNKSKKDYNYEEPGKVWDESSLEAHWRNRPEGTPFFAIMNSIESHEGKVRTRKDPLIHDPAKAPIPVYHPDTEQVRLDWARYYDVVSNADAAAGKYLKALEADGLAENTIVFYYADHGAGLARSKRSPYNSGLQVPLIVYIPEKFKELRPPEYTDGGASERLVDFVDLAPTLLSLVGIKPPEWMQGHAFLGKFQKAGPEFLFGGRGRMDERYDLSRCVTNGRFVYIRNYMPHRIPGQRIDYMFQTRTTQDWHQLHLEGKLTPEQEIFWQPKAPEELYDLHNDPDEVHNLASSQEHLSILLKMRAAQQKQARKIRDLGFLPEEELFTRAPGVAPFDFRNNDDIYPFERIFATAESASMLSPEAIPQLIDSMNDPDSAVRYWATLGLLMRKEDGVSKGKKELEKALSDVSPYVQIAAAEALISFGSSDRLKQRSFEILIRLADPRSNPPLISIMALNSIDLLGEKGQPLVEQIKDLSIIQFPDNSLYDSYPPRLIKEITNRLNKPASAVTGK